ncbi:MAG: flavodoxin domain-containing protein [Candidatus Verstraetearchaeota archaeon]|nr:flavodoxin domain-containing protein [Candidatus Verstraetearchaeota archaeon]
MKSALIVYGTRTGTAAATAQEIAEEFQRLGVEVKVADAKKEKVESIDQYDLVVVGSGIQMGKWTGEADSFLKRFRKELKEKSVALYVNCGSAAEAMNVGKPEVAANAREKYLEEKAARHGLTPVALGFFGAIYDFNRMPWIMRKGMEHERPKLAAAYRETAPGVYDTRDLEGIKAWARGLVG